MLRLGGGPQPSAVSYDSEELGANQRETMFDYFEKTLVKKAKARLSGPPEIAAT